MSELVRKVAIAIRDADASKNGCAADAAPEYFLPLARAAIEAMRFLPEEPGPGYTAGEYSRRNQAAMVDDALTQP